MVEAPLRAAATAVISRKTTDPRDALEVEAVARRNSVLRRREGIDDELCFRLDRNRETPLARIFGEQRAPSAYARHHRRLVVLQLGIVRHLIMPQTGRRGPTKQIVPAVNRNPMKRSNNLIADFAADAP
jgi:hypothetical protein